MASTLHLIGDLSWGFENPSLGIYTDTGLRWSAQELKEVRAIYALSNVNHLEKLCDFCEQLYKLQQLEKFKHQPGYRALATSASNCSLCWLLLLSLNYGIPSWIFNGDRTQNIDEQPLIEVTDSIEIIGLPANPKANHNLLRFIATWTGTGFTWPGKIVGIYKRKIGDAPSPFIWSSSECENFNARYPIIQKWITECQNNHPSCSFVDAPNLPTRVLDVGEGDFDTPICLVSPIGEKSNYIALSHCWGGITPITTTRDTLASRMREIEFSDLPRTFREAIEITRMLGIRYLWIDTLCIIQDDPKEWEREALSMCRIYQDSFLTIAASAAEDCNSGLFHPFVPACINVGGDEEFVAAVRFGDRHSSQRHSPLENRAWAMQEDLLSGRVLCFAQPQLFWRCKENVTSEDGLLDEIAWEQSSFVRMRNDFVKSKIDDLKSAHESWRRLCENYSQRHLTYEKDKLPAFAGMTVYFKQLLSDEPIVGLWVDDLVPGLLWRIKCLDDHDQPRTSLQNIPSWSWMSVTGSIDYTPPWYITGLRNDGYYADPKLEVRSTSATWTGIPLSSTLQESKLEVRGFLLRTSFITDSSYASPAITLKREENIGNNDSIGSGSLDFTNEDLKSTVWCLHLATTTSFDLSRNRSQHGIFIVMLLQPVEIFQDTYQRIGLGEISSGVEEGKDLISFKQRLQEAEERTIVLV